MRVAIGNAAWPMVRWLPFLSGIFWITFWKILLDSCCPLSSAMFWVFLWIFWMNESDLSGRCFLMRCVFLLRSVAFSGLIRYLSGRFFLIRCVFLLRSRLRRSGCVFFSLLRDSTCGFLLRGVQFTSESVRLDSILNVQNSGRESPFPHFGAQGVTMVGIHERSAREKIHSGQTARIQ